LFSYPTGIVRKVRPFGYGRTSVPRRYLEKHRYRLAVAPRYEVRMRKSHWTFVGRIFRWSVRTTIFMVRSGRHSSLCDRLSLSGWHKHLIVVFFRRELRGVERFCETVGPVSVPWHGEQFDLSSLYAPTYVVETSCDVLGTSRLTRRVSYIHGCFGVHAKRQRQWLPGLRRSP
jgi:hypothetical protein